MCVCRNPSLPSLQQWVISIRSTKSVTYLLPTESVCVFVGRGGRDGDQGVAHLTFHKSRDKEASCSSLANQPYLYKNTAIHATCWRIYLTDLCFLEHLGFLTKRRHCALVFFSCRETWWNGLGLCIKELGLNETGVRLFLCSPPLRSHILSVP